MDPEVQHEPSEITYDEKFYPARPRPLRPSVRRADRNRAAPVEGDPSAANPEYVDWLTEKSMLHDAKLAQKMAQRLDELGVYVSAFFFPVVPKGAARIRTQMNAALTREDLDAALEAFAQAGRELGVIE